MLDAGLRGYAEWQCSVPSAPRDDGMVLEPASECGAYAGTPFRDSPRMPQNVDALQVEGPAHPLDVRHQRVQPHRRAVHTPPRPSAKPLVEVHQLEVTGERPQPPARCRFCHTKHPAQLSTRRQALLSGAASGNTLVIPYGTTLENAMGRSIVAIASAVGALLLIVIIGTVAAAAVFPAADGVLSGSYLAANLGVSLVAAAVAGAGAARLAPRRPLAHAGAVVLVLLALSVSGGSAADGQPDWYPLTVLLLGVLGVAGGALAVLGCRRRRAIARG